MVKNTRGLLFSVLPTIIVAAVYSLILFVVVDDKERIFWMSYGFTIGAIALDIVCSIIVVGRDEYPKKTFLGLSVLGLGKVYIAVQIVAGITLMFLPESNWKISLIVQVILLALFLISAGMALAVREHTIAFERDVAEKRFYIQSLAGDIEGMALSVQDAAAKKALKDLMESIKYSDPMSSNALSTIEGKIETLVAELSEMVGNGDTAATKSKAAEIEAAMAERNRKVRLLK